MKKFKNRLFVALAAALCALSLCVPVMAADSGSANQAVVTAMTGVASDMISTGTAILPVALGVVGLILVVTFGIKIFKGVAKK